MTNRRSFALGALGTLAAPAAGLAAPRPKGPVMLPGNPPKLDFGGGLLIPMDSTIFKVLWEGPDRWITYGRAVSRVEVRAMGQAETAAIGTMKLMLLTLAFAPERLERIDGGGWRLKSGNTDDLVRGDVRLPGRPVMPTTDLHSADGNAGEPLIHALTGYMVMKADVTIEDVRARARLVDGSLSSKPTAG